MTITSVTNEKVKQLLKLNLKKYRQETGLYVVEGKHMVEEAIAAGLCLEVYATDPDDTGFEPVFILSGTVMAKLSQVDSPQGILALCEKPKNAVLGDQILLLDTVADPGNMGTLLRTALAFGFHTVLTDGCVDVTNPKVLRSTQGAFFHLSILETPIPEFIRDHREYKYFGTDLHGGIPLSQLAAVPRKTGLVLGNEASGVRKEILRLTDQNLFIEISGIESLNVAVAGSILMYALKKTKEEMTP